MESQCGHFQETPFAIRAAKGETMRKGCWFGCFLLFSLLHVHAAELGGPSGGGGREACAFLSKPITWEPHTWGQVGELLGTIVPHIHWKRAIAVYSTLLIQS